MTSKKSNKKTTDTSSGGSEEAAPKEKRDWLAEYRARKAAERPVDKVLTDRQMLFVAEYLIDMDGTRAARMLGYKNPAQTASSLLDKRKNPHIARAIAEEMEKKKEYCRVEARDVVNELAKIAFFNHKKLLGEDGLPLDLKDLPDDVAAAIQDLEISYTCNAEYVKNNKGEGKGSGKGGNKKGEEEEPSEDVEFNRIKHLKMKFHPKLDALKQISQHLGFVKDQTTINNNTTINVIDYDRLYHRPKMVDAVEDRIRAVEQLADTKPATPPDEDQSRS